MITGRLLCWAGIVPHINRIATEIRTALMLRLLRRYFGIAALLRPLFIFPQAARGSGGRWLENKTLTRIQMPKQGLAVTSVADPGTCGDRVGAGGGLIHRLGAGREGSRVLAPRVFFSDCTVPAPVFPWTLGIGRFVVRNVPCQLSHDKFLKKIDGGRFADPD